MATRKRKNPGRVGKWIKATAVKVIREGSNLRVKLSKAAKIPAGWTPVKAVRVFLEGNRPTVEVKREGWLGESVSRVGNPKKKAWEVWTREPFTKRKKTIFGETHSKAHAKAIAKRLKSEGFSMVSIKQGDLIGSKWRGDLDTSPSYRGRKRR